jgi:hypothetical protein
MRRTVWLSLIGLLVATGTFIGLEVGRRAGYYDGHHRGAFSADVGTAFIAITAVRAQEKGDAKGAQDMLELLVDQALTDEWAEHRYNFRPPLLVASAEYFAPETNSMTKLADYRRLHPHAHRRSLINEMVASVLARYGTPTADQPPTIEPPDEQKHRGVH